MTEIFSPQALTAFFQVVMIDLVLAGDNAIVIGLAAAGLPKSQRNKAILVGIIAATILRIGFASITVQLLQIIGLLLAGGVLLLWVCWKMWRELRTAHAHHQTTKFEKLSVCKASTAAVAPAQDPGPGHLADHIADVSMSLDNVLAVAGAAREHPIILIFGLGLSIALMGLAANFIARLLQKHRWIAYVGLADHPLCGVRHVLSRRTGDMAERRQGLRGALIGIGESAPIRDR